MRGFRAVVLLSLLGLVSCSFVFQKGPVDPHGGKVTADSKQVVVSSGEADLLGGTLFIRGVNLRVNDPSCKAVQLHLECTLPKMAPRKNFVLPLAGENVIADALLDRKEGQFWARKVGLE